MIRSTRAALLILALLCPSLLWLTPWGQAHISAQMSHAWAHAQDAAHHHGQGSDHDHDHDHGPAHGSVHAHHLNDPSLQLDEVGSGAAHNHQHHHHDAAQPIGLLPCGDGAGFGSLGAIRFMRFAPPIVAVFLQAPLRPPQRHLA